MSRKKPPRTVADVLDADGTIRTMPSAQYIVDRLDIARGLERHAANELARREAREFLREVTAELQAIIDLAVLAFQQQAKGDDERHAAAVPTRERFAKALETVLERGIRLSAGTIAQHWPEGPVPGKTRLGELLREWREAHPDAAGR